MVNVSTIKVAGVLFGMVLVQTLVGCSKDDEPKGSSKKIVVKAEALSGVLVNRVVL